MSSRRGLVIGVLSLILLGSKVATATGQVESWVREGWKTDFSRTLVDFEEVMSGGPPRDGIPPIDDPIFIPARDVVDLDGREPVILFPLEGESRAYPLRVLTWHEIVNDEIDGQPVAVTYCPLCNAAIVFDRRADGETLSFGTTGKLRHSDLIMYDRSTESWWQQFSGEAIVGDFVGTDLTMLPSRIVSFADFLGAHPDGLVLVPNDPAARPYGNNPYQSYDTAQRPFLFRGELPPDIPAMAHVVVVETDSEPIIVSLNRIRQSPLQLRGYSFSYKTGVASALDTATISDGRDIGSVRVTRDGQDVVHNLTFAFVAHVFHPDVAIIDADAH
ncbi:DUF3179 domain-containing protein [Devosia marina]|uniref:DUF3179 domain-containing protein n=1 Tax=Devosia marina TaxID=2683198 RepID=A0A7X3FUI8_9HYPH|nr:DUF3179 domain-containing protein [Devosia marina]MVT01014.1 DUF3179 domain-containing protein [Devosia marina]